MSEFAQLDPADHLQTDAADYTEYPTGVEHERHERHNQTIIREMRIDELQHVENELNFYEKVPLLFLLCGDSVNGAQFILQRLIVNYHASLQLSTSILQEWARSTPDWAPKLIEALAIVRSDTVLRRYGLHLAVLKARLTPQRPDSNHLVHPILKWLLHVCEHLQPAETRQLINAVCAAHPDPRYKLRDLPGAPERYLEFWLLLWLSERLIAVGDYAPGRSAYNRTNHCDVDAIVHALLATKATGGDGTVRLGENLRSAQIRINFTSENVIRKDRLDECQRQDGAAELSVAVSDLAITPAASMSNNGDRYVVHSSAAGFALIIDQENFHRTAESAPTKKPLDRRSGTVHDRYSLMNTFSKLGYLCETHCDLRAAEIEQRIEQIAKRSAGKDSLVVCILSHGFDGHIYGSDTVPVSIDQVLRRMASPQLVLKPKVLVVQACQGEQVQELVFQEDVLATDGPTEGSASGDAVRAPLWQAGQGYHKYADVCIAQSTMNGFVSYRQATRGTWFIQTLCKHIDDYGKRMHFLDILTKVIQSVTQERGPRGESQMPKITTTLCKSFFLPQMPSLEQLPR